MLKLTDNEAWIMMIGLVAWCTILGFARRDPEVGAVLLLAVLRLAVLDLAVLRLAARLRAAPQIGYAALVAAFTAGIIIIDYDASLEYGDVALARIEMTCYGLMIWVIVCVLVLPGKLPALHCIALLAAACSTELSHIPLLAPTGGVGV